MRVVLIGEVQFSLAMFREISQSDLNIVAVVTRATETLSSDKVDMVSFANDIGIQAKIVASVNDPDVVAWLTDLRPDVIFCLGWSEILQSEILAICPGRLIGYHPSSLPRNRGRHPLIWALVLGLREISSTFFFIDEGADSGDIISQRPVYIDHDDYAADLYQKVIDVASIQVRSICRALIDNDLVGIPQNKTKATYWRKRSLKDGSIDWRMSSSSIRNLVRALSDPYPGATFQVRGENIVCRRAREIDCDSLDTEPGKVLRVLGSVLIVKTGDGAIELSALSPIPRVAEGDYL